MTHVLKKVSKLKAVMVPVTPVVVHVNHGQNGVHAMSHVELELKLVIVLVALIKDVLMQHKIDRVIPVPLVQIVLRVKIGLNGAFAVPHVVQEQEHVPNHVVMQVVQIIPKVKTVTPRVVQSFVKQSAILGLRGHLVVPPVVVVLQQGHVVVRHRLKMYAIILKVKIVTLIIVLSFVTQIVILGLRGHLVVLLVVVVLQHGRVVVRDQLKIHVRHRKTKIVEWMFVHPTHVSHVQVQLVPGLNGDSAVGHVVAELKLDLGCCAVRIAIPKKNLDYVQQIHVAVHHVMNVVILGVHGVIVMQHVMDLKREHVLVAYMSTVQTVIPR